MTRLTFADRALSVGETLVVADVHAGRARASNVEYPLGERSDLRERIGDLLDRFDPAEVVVAGDLLHAFDRVPPAVEATVEAIRALVADAGAEFVAVRGNHDAMLDAVGIGGVDAHRLDGGVVCHGHEEPSAEAQRYLVGHEHPTITIEGERHPCFLVGEGVYRGADVVVLPAFSALAPGREVNGLRSAETLSPLIGDLDAFRPVVVADGDPLEFPPLGELRPLL